MTKGDRQELLDFVGDLAADQLDHFCDRERARLYEGLALIYQGEKAEVCAFAAVAIRKAEAAQLKFRELLKPETAK
jgi:hypothetical protein